MMTVARRVVMRTRKMRSKITKRMTLRRSCSAEDSATPCLPPAHESVFFIVVVIINAEAKVTPH